MRKQKKTEYTFLIICEGENTEPTFFKLIRNKIIDGIYRVGSFDSHEIRITIIPEPKPDEDEEKGDEQDEKNPVKHKPERAKRILIKTNNEEIEPSYPVPLNYVKKAQEYLEVGSFHEVWVVFDNDNHPGLQKAFEEAKNIINGLNVNIAFSSISFEYYLLLHFERLVTKFLKSECRETAAKKKKLFYCGTGVHQNDCQGSNCVGGYARKRSYWKNSKETTSTFLLVENKLLLGFINSAWLRFQSMLNSSLIETYERDPYTNADLLVKRLTGNDNFTYTWILTNESEQLEEIVLNFVPNKLIINNPSGKSIVLPVSFLTYLNPLNLELVEFNARKVLLPRENIEFLLPNINFNNIGCFICTLNQTRLCFS